MGSRLGTRQPESLDSSSSVTALISELRRQRPPLGSRVLRSRAAEAPMPGKPIAIERGPVRGRPLVLHCPAGLRDCWPRPLAWLWHRLYPDLFDDDDLRLALNQPRYHFVEWFAAVHLFHTHGVRALVSKYGYETHPRKRRLAEKLLGQAGRAYLRRRLEGQPPDLLLFRPDLSAFWFAEVKGPRDRLRQAQLRNHRRLASRFSVRVDVITVCYVSDEVRRR